MLYNMLMTMYSNPEDYGLTVFRVIEDTNLSYEFDMTVVFRKGNTLLWGRDQGCSCPAPFQDYESADDLTKLDSWESLKAFSAFIFENYPDADSIQKLVDVVSYVSDWLGD